MRIVHIESRRTPRELNNNIDILNSCCPVYDENVTAELARACTREDFFNFIPRTPFLLLDALLLRRAAAGVTSPTTIPTTTLPHSL